MSTRDNILEMLLDSKDYISGETLAGKLGVGRNSVWKAVKQLQSEGFEIQAVKNKGYILNDIADIIDHVLIRHFLKENKDHEIFVFDEIDSTNNYAKELARKSAAAGTVVAADCQTAGKGRMGRSFCSPPGISVYMSVILRPETDMETSQLITSCAAVAAAAAVDRLCGTDTKIKWVNDLFLGGRKICGILTEASVNFETGTPDFAVVGIGINVKSVKNAFPEELLKTASSIEDEAKTVPLRSQLIAEILMNLDNLTADLSDKSFLEEYKRRSFIIGHKVAVSKFTDERMATAVGISENAGLIVRYDDGTEEILNSGEARIIPAK
ncbi:biotin--[acetyl-CoA-carboxylase] ligase [Porcipelethomonas sp.]|uniref:biotin--[acetyl-CoA-carboxylase] ligase n=1 Tax=Porcipelethomonas sp. TaxID=2981675 RepID=UPI003EF449E5